MSCPSTNPTPRDGPARIPHDHVTLRFAGDSGDGMLLTGHQFSATSLHLGNDVHTSILASSEIRAPEGSIAGVSAFQLQFGNHPLHTAGDRLDALVVMNPAALRLHLGDLKPGGLLVVNENAFEPSDLIKAGYTDNPLQDGSLAAYRVLNVPVDRLNREAVAPVKLLAPREADRCRNFFALGLAFWLFDRPLEPSLRWIREKFLKNPVIVDAHTRSLKAGHRFGEATHQAAFTIPSKETLREPGRYRRVTGYESLSLGLAAAAERMDLPLVFASYPAVPASDLQQHFFALQHLGVRCVNAEDDLAALGMAIGAAYGGGLGVTTTSGPGLSLMSQALGLAVRVEMPVIVLVVQKQLACLSEQGDLLQAIFGRSGESAAIVLAPCSPADGFACALDAARLAIEAMAPVILLTDTHLGSSSSPWRVPTPDELTPISVRTSTQTLEGSHRPASRPWIRPGTPGQENRLGGAESYANGHAAGDPSSRDHLLAQRSANLARIASAVPPLETVGPESGELLVLGWGSTWGTIHSAVVDCQEQGIAVAGAVVRSLHPLPCNLGDVLRRYRHVLIPELNTGQLLWLVRARYLIDAVGLANVSDRPFGVDEIKARILTMVHKS